MICKTCWKDYIWHFNSNYCCVECKKEWKLQWQRKWYKSEKWKEAMIRWYKNPKRAITELKYRSSEKYRIWNLKRAKKYYQTIKDSEEFKKKRSEKYKIYIENNYDKVVKSRRMASRRYKKTPNWKMVFNLNRHKRRVLQRDDDACTKKEWIDILKANNYSCKYCWSGDNIEIDHIIPISKWWNHTKENLQPLCRNCNAKKNNKILINNILYKWK